MCVEFAEQEAKKSIRIGEKYRWGTDPMIYKVTDNQEGDKSVLVWQFPTGELGGGVFSNDYIRTLKLVSN